MLQAPMRVGTLAMFMVAACFISALEEVPVEMNEEKNSATWSEVTPLGHHPYNSMAMIAPRGEHRLYGRDVFARKGGIPTKLDGEECDCHCDSAGSPQRHPEVLNQVDSWVEHDERKLPDHHHATFFSQDAYALTMDDAWRGEARAEDEFDEEDEEADDAAAVAEYQHRVGTEGATQRPRTIGEYGRALGITLEDMDTEDDELETVDVATGYGDGDGGDGDGEGGGDGDGDGDGDGQMSEADGGFDLDKLIVDMKQGYKAEYDALKKNQTMEKHRYKGAKHYYKKARHQLRKTFRHRKKMIRHEYKHQKKKDKHDYKAAKKNPPNGESKSEVKSAYKTQKKHTKHLKKSLKKKLKKFKKEEKRYLKMLWKKAKKEYKAFKKKLHKASFQYKWLPKILKIMEPKLQESLANSSFAKNGAGGHGANAVNDSASEGVQAREKLKFVVHYTIFQAINPKLKQVIDKIMSMVWGIVDKIVEALKEALCGAVAEIPFVGAILSDAIMEVIDGVYGNAKNAINKAIDNLRVTIENKIIDAIVNAVFDPAISTGTTMNTDPGQLASAGDKAGDAQAEKSQAGYKKTADAGKAAAADAQNSMISDSNSASDKEAQEKQAETAEEELLDVEDEKWEKEEDEFEELEEEAEEEEDIREAAQELVELPDSD